MKKMLGRLALISIAVLASACARTTSSEESISSIPESSAQPVESSIASTSQNSVPSQSSSNSNIVNNQLSTADGLKVYFDAKGARISKIEYANKQIAKDGFTVGRCANRIANGKFTLNGTEYNVTKNVGQHSLHGGGNQWQGPFANANWTKVEQTESSIKYSLHSADKDNGYPGNLDVTVEYTLSEAGELQIQYTAVSDKDTLFNPTNHLFMGLNGNRSYSNVKLQINADNYTPLKDQIPTGAISTVEGTQFDYRSEKTFDSNKAYDDNYVLNGDVGEYRKVATMTGTSLGVKVDVYTDRAGLQLYKDGSGSICLETQMFPDMINQPTFAEYGTTVLKAGEEFYSKTAYVFSAI